jgi:hypothetical protein
MKYTEISLSGKGKEKRVYYEWIRLTACFFVIFNHLKGYVLFQNASGAKQLFYMVLSVITKINVPLFFMVRRAALGKARGYFHGFKKAGQQDLSGYPAFFSGHLHGVPVVRARAGQGLRIYGEAFPLRGI